MPDGVELSERASLWFSKSALLFAFCSVGLPCENWASAQGLPSREVAPSGAEENRTRVVSRGLNFANALLNERRYELASEEFERFLKTGPALAEQAEAEYGLGRALLSLKRYTDARGHFETFLKLTPEGVQAPNARFRLAEAAFLARDFAAARVLFEDYLKLHPGHAHRDAAWPYLGDVRSSLGDLPGARAAYETAISEFPKGPLSDRAQFFLAKVLAGQKETDAALNQLRELSKKTGSDWSERARLQIPQVLMGAGRYEAALAEIDLMQRSQPVGAIQGELELRRCEALVGLKRSDEAEVALKALVARDDVSAAVSAQAGYGLGQIAWQRGEFSAALSAWESAQGRGPSPALAPMLLFRSGEALTKVGQAEAARTRFLRLADQYPGDVWADQALLQAGRLALESNESASATVAAERVLKDYPRSQYRADARFILGRAAQIGGRPAEAIRIYRQLLTEDKPGPETNQAALYHLSQAYKATGQTDQAGEALAEIAKNPNMSMAGNAQYTLGQAHFEGGRYAQAIEAIGAFLKGNHESPLVPHALAYMVLAHDALGQSTDSQGRLDQLARDWPASEDLLRVQLRMGEQALDANQYDRAVELLTLAAKDRPTGDLTAVSESEPWTARARVGLGWALLGQEKPDKAAECFSQALETKPKLSREMSAEAAYMLGFSSERANQVDRALEAYAQAMATYGDLGQGASAALARARLLAKSGRAGEASDVISSLIRTHPKGLDGQNGIGKLLMEMAKNQQVAGQTEAASDTYQRVLKEAPGSSEAAEAMLALAEHAVRLKRYGEARGFLESIVSQTKPDSAEAPQREQALLRLGRILLDEGKTDEAATQFQRVIDESAQGQSRDLARFWHAEAQYRGEHPELAEPEFGSLASEGAKLADMEPWRDTARLRRIQCLVSLRRWSNVQTEVDGFLADRPNFSNRAELYIARGRALQSQALPRFEESRSAFGRAIELSPGTEVAARAQLFVGESLMHEKNYRDALRAFHEVELLYKVPKLQANALLEAGSCYTALGRSDQAAEVYRKLIQNFSDQATADEARKRLDAISLAPAVSVPR